MTTPVRARFGCVLLVALLTVSCGTAGDPAVPQRPASNAGKVDTPDTGEAVADVRLELLRVARSDGAAAGRNPFRFVTRVVASTAPRPVALPPRPVVSAPAAPAGPPPIPPIPMKFIGLLEAERSGRVAILADGRGNVSYGKEGDIIEGRYQVIKIGVESVELAYSDGRGRQTIRLSGQ